MMEDKDAAAKPAPEVEAAAGQLSEDELNTVAGGISVHPETFHPEPFATKLP